MNLLKCCLLLFSVIVPTCCAKISIIPKEITEAIPDQEEQQCLAFLNALIDLVKKSYIKEFTNEEIMEKIVTGFFNEFDPHTNYLDEKTLAFLKEEINGKFGGLGLYIVPYEGFIKVLSCLDGTPAIKHLLPGDIITHVNGKFIHGMNIEKVTHLLKGKPGTKVTIKIKRKNKDVFEQTITREIIKLPLIKTQIHDDIAYVKLSIFYDKVSKDLGKFVKEIISNKKIKGLIIDLRLNPGGVLEEVIDIFDLFLPKGSPVVTIRDRRSHISIKTTKDPFVKDLPVVVLINAISASAAEILAGTLQLYKKAIIVGEQSYGKGSVQQLVPVSEKTAIKMTTAKYYLPGDIDIQARGITPDIEVKTEYSDLISFREKDMPHTLKPDNYKEEEKKLSKSEEDSKISELDEKIKKDAKKKGKDKKENKKEKETFDAEDFILYKKMPLDKLIKKDPQLAKAFEVVKSLAEGKGNETKETTEKDADGKKQRLKTESKTNDENHISEKVTN